MDFLDQFADFKSRNRSPHDLRTIEEIFLSEYFKLKQELAEGESKEMATKIGPFVPPSVQGTRTNTVNSRKSK